MDVSFWNFFYQVFWTHAYTEGMSKNRTQVPCEVPFLPNPTNRKGWPHHRGLRPLTLLEQWSGFFYVPQEQISKSVL